MSIQQAIKSFHIFCKILGLSAFNYKSKFFKILHIFRTIILILIVIYYYYTDLKNSSLNYKKSRSKLMFQINQISYAILFSYTTISSIFTNQLINECLKEIDEIQMKIITIENNSNTNKINEILWNNKKIQLWSIYQIIFIIIIASIAFSFSSYKQIDMTFINIYIETVNNLNVLYFCNGLLILRNFFQWINIKIQLLYYSIFYNNYLNILIDIHSKLISLTKNWNSIFNISLLLIITHAFVIITTSLVKIYDEFNDLSNHNENENENILIILFRELRNEILQIFVIITLIVCSDKISEEVCMYIQYECMYQS